VAISWGSCSRGAEKGLTGDKEHDELRCLWKLVPVTLGGKLLHVGTDLAGVGLQVAETFFFGGGFQGIQVGLQWRFGIDHQELPSWQMHNEIRAQAGCLTIAPHLPLFNEVAVGTHPGQLHHPPQGHFPPTAAYLRQSQGLDQFAGFADEVRLSGAKAFHLL